MTDTPNQPETKHDKFLRLMQYRLERTLESMRILTNLASPNYVHTPEEAVEVIEVLDGKLREVAEIFGVSFKSVVGTRKGRGPSKMLGAVNEIDVAKAIAYIETGQYDLAKVQLQAALAQNPR